MLAIPYGYQVAVKKLYSHHSQNAETVSTLLKETRILCRARHPSVVLLLGLCIDEGDQSIVTEYVSGSDLLAVDISENTMTL